MPFAVVRALNVLLDHSLIDLARNGDFAFLELGKV